MPSIDDKPLRVSGGRFSKEATSPETYLDEVHEVEGFDDEATAGAGALPGKSVYVGSSTDDASPSYGKSGPNSFGTEESGSSWGGHEVMAPLIAQQQAWASMDFPMFPPAFPPQCPGMPPPFPWWEMYYSGPLMPTPGQEKDLFEQMVQNYGQVAQQHARVPQQGGRQQQKGKGQAVPKQAPTAAPKQEPDPPGNQDKEDDPSYTTVMLKNVPSSYNRELLIKMLNEVGFHKLYNFVYLPVEFKKKTLLGYAFVNLINHETAVSFKKTMQGYKHWLKDTQGNRLELNGEAIKAAEVRWGKHHDKQLHIQRYRSSDLMHPSVPAEYKPMVFGEDGELEVFPGPEPGTRTQPPRAVKADQPGARKKLLDATALAQ